MLSRIKETDVEVPYKEGGYFYYLRTEAGKQYGIRCRKKGSMDAPEEIVLDVNELAKGQKFMSLEHTMSATTETCSLTRRTTRDSANSRWR